MPSKALAAQADAAAERGAKEAAERAANERELVRASEAHARSMAAVKKTEAEVRAFEGRAAEAVGAALAQYFEAQERELFEKAQQRGAAVRAEVQEEMKTAEYAALDEVLSHVKVHELSVGSKAGANDQTDTYAGTMAIMEAAKAVVYERFSDELQRRLAGGWHQRSQRRGRASLP